MLQIDHVNLAKDSRLSDLLRPEDYEKVRPLLDALEGGGSSAGAALAEVEIRVQSGGRELLVVCTGGRIVAHDGGNLGFVLLFDDITELSRAQHLAAWRDVARRIAHEIKNPLTPIQLSAQRLEKLLSGSDVAAVQESTRTIVEHVAIIKRLANEFSEYGRMPTAYFSPTDLTILLQHTVDTFKADNPQVQFSFSVDGKLPEMLLDAEQIRGVVINLMNNAVAAVQGAPDAAVSVKATFERRSQRAVLEIVDNGAGIPAADKSRIFEPYFTTKKGGTGLGLAIVSSIISDHQGEIRVFDNYPRGTRFVVSIPQHPQPSTVRKLVGA
jgi:two-component system nitrogen regulation sensor histidine kinase NtrY